MDQVGKINLDIPETRTGAQSRSIPRPALFGGIYLLIILAAVLMRFSSLGQIPLSPAESKEALAAWQYIQADPQVIDISSPAYFSLTSLIMTFFGSSDVTARLIPALFGIGLIILPWLLWSRLGPLTALGTALLFTVSPLYAITSRTAGGDAIALFALLLTAISLIRLTFERRSLWLYVLAVAFGLGLASTALYYGGLVTLLIAWWGFGKISLDPLPIPRFRREEVIQAVAVGVVILLALSTRFFTYLPGIAGSARLVGDWILQFGFMGDLQALLDPFLVLARYEIILFPLGIFAIFWALWGNWQRGGLFTYWIFAGLILILLQGGVLSNALLIPLPGYLLLALATDRLLIRGVFRPMWMLTGIYLLLSAVIFINLFRILRLIPSDADLGLLLREIFYANTTLPIANLWIIFLALIGIMFITYTFWYMGPWSVVQAGWLTVFLLAIFYQWGTAWQLTHASANDPRERWVQEAADDEVPVMMRILVDISNSATNSDSDLQIFSAIDSPVLRWYLRDFWNAQIGETLPPGLQADVIITPESMNNPSFGSDYLGSDFGLHRIESSPTLLGENPILNTLRWWFFFDSPEAINEERVIFWVRADLVQS